MHRACIVAVAAALVTASACLDVSNPAPLDSQLRIINATSVSINISVDGQATITGSAPTNISAIFLAAGPHDVALTAHGSTASLHVQTAEGAVTTAYVYSSAAGSLDAATLDTGSVVAAGRSKLRVVNLSPTADTLEIWRTQPDFPTPVRIMTPFPYLAASPYLESSSGAWEVFVAARGDSTAKVASTGIFGIEGGGRRTVVLLDSAGKIVTRVAPE